MLHGVLHLLGMDHETDSGKWRAETRWRGNWACRRPDRAGAAMMIGSSFLAAAAVRCWCSSPASRRSISKACACARAICLRCNTSNPTLEAALNLRSEEGALTFSAVEAHLSGALRRFVLAR
jgi:hypothetical protein